MKEYDNFNDDVEVEEKHTKFEEIYHIFLSTIKDYSLKRLFQYDLNVAEDLMSVYLIRAISKFNNCIKDLSDYNLDQFEFNIELDNKEINILSDLMVLSWLDNLVNDITQMNFQLNDNDFKHYSEEKNLKEKSQYADRWREKVNQEMLEYGFKHTPFKEWAVGNFEL